MTVSTDPATDIPRAKAERKRKLSKSQSTEQIRNRENQRRLRERRKEYTEELERRLHTLQSEGIQATAVVQRAARLVVEENKLLRQLLGNYGLSEQVLDDYIRQAVEPRKIDSQDGPIVRNPVAASIQLQSPVTSAPIHSPGRPFHTNPPSDEQYAIPEMCTVFSPRPSLQIQEPSILLLNDEESKDIPGLMPAEPTTTHGCCNGMVGKPSSSGQMSQATTKSTAIDEMDCEEAARIITSLRGGGDPRDVWPELGCSNMKKTSIKNTLLMSLAG